MIMPADPKVGDASRPENIPGLVFEEVVVTELARTVPGPRGPVKALVSRELHSDGSFSDKLFVPGYGEFYSAHEGDVEALALAVPIDAVKAAVAGELGTLLRGAYGVFDLAASKRWKEAAVTVAWMDAAWKAHRAAGGVPPRLVGPTSSALAALTRAVKAQEVSRARHAALDVALATLDLQLQYRSLAWIERARGDLWARQVLVDAADRDAGGVTSDVATLEWIRDRFARAIDSVDLARIDTLLDELRTNAADEDFAAATTTAQTLRKALARARPLR
jgi:hypothetical protein